MHIMALDVGKKRIGIALSDSEEILALPLLTLVRKELKSDLETIIALAHQRGVGTIVLGMPYLLDGREGKQAQSVREFMQQLAVKTDVPVETWDERFSTVAANKMLTESGIKKSKKKEHEDTLAAVFILQGYLDRRRNSG